MTIDIEQPCSVSVIVPCFNAHRFLDRTLSSLVAQTIPVEIIVVDDGSSDPETIEMLASLDPSIIIIRQPNRGLPAARNAGFRRASGQYILPLDSDDWLEPNAVEELLKALQNHPETGFACSYMQLEGEALGVLPTRYNFFEQLFLNQIPYCILIAKATWEAIGGYDEMMRRGYEDWEFNIRLGKHGKFAAIVEQPLFHYRVSRNGMLGSLSTHIHGDLWRGIQQKHADLYETSKLFTLWREWRNKPSSYPLPLYFPWLALHRFCPAPWFPRLFRLLRSHSQAQRITRRMLKGRAAKGEINGDTSLSFRDRIRYLIQNLQRNLRRSRGPRPSPIAFSAMSLDSAQTASPGRMLTEAFIELQLPKLLPPQPANILEIGCGSGRLAGDLHKLGYSGSYTGIDVRTNFIRPSKEDGLDRIFHHLDAHQYRPPHPLDLIISVSVLEHIADDKLLLRRLHGFLTHKGWQVHIVPSAWGLCLYLWHGYRQYSLDALKVKSVSTGMRVYALGGMATFLVHLTCITIPEILLRYPFRRRFPSFYSSLLRRAAQLDRHGPRVPIMYAVCWPAADAAPQLTDGGYE